MLTLSHSRSINRWFLVRWRWLAVALLDPADICLRRLGSHLLHRA